MSNKIIGCLASIPQREHLLKESVAGIAKQLDTLYVILNGYVSIPDFLNIENVVATLSDNSLGAAAKMLFAKDHDGYYFCFDDDLLYAGNYVSTMISRIEAFGRKAVVSLHGAVMPNGEKLYYFERANKIHEVDIVGTGVCAFYAPNVSVSVGDFVEKNKVDLQFGLFCKNKGIKMAVIPHGVNLVTNLDPDEITPCLWHLTSWEETGLWRDAHTKKPLLNTLETCDFDDGQ